jgi:DNA-binding response OmpR family regulator
VHLITKPFTFAALAEKIREILDAHSGPARILLVEDEALVRMLAIEYLESAGYEVEWASTAVQAIHKARLADIHAAIVDMGLPDRKGDVLVIQLRALYPRLPILIASGYAEAELRNHFRNDPRIAFVGKPYTQQQLVDAIRLLAK